MPKTIFGTTEKSNFILNLKTEDYYKYNLRVMMLFMILMPLFSLPLEFFKVYSVPGIALAISGVFAIVFMFIGFMKSATPKALWLPAGLLGAMVVWGYVSLFNSYYYNISTFGADGRSEGLLSVLFYGSFFMLGAQLGTDGNRKKLLNAMLWMGLAECGWGLLQTFGMPSNYKNLEPLLLFRVFLPSGLTGSPIFLATLLVMLAFPALLGSIFEEEKKQRLFYTVCAAVFAVFAAKTQCLIGVGGMGLCIAAALVVALCKKGGKQALVKGVVVLAAFGVGIGWMCAAPILNKTVSSVRGDAIDTGFVLYDGAIMWEDSSYRLEVSGYYMPSVSRNPNGTFEMRSIPETYGYLWSSTLKIVQKYPLVGSGPDNLVYPQLYQSLAVGANPNTFDRAYDYYLQLAATMGVPALVLFLAVMVIAVVQGGRACKSSTWLRTGILGAVVLYLAVMVVGSSCITVAPLFWMLAGCCAGMKRE